MTCHFTLSCGAGVENSPAKKKRKRLWFGFGWISACANLDRLQSRAPPRPVLASAEEMMWGWRKWRGREVARGVLSCWARGGFLKPRQSIVTSAVWYRALSCRRRVWAAHPALAGAVSLWSRKVWRGRCVPPPQSCCWVPPQDAAFGAPCAPSDGSPCRCRDERYVGADVSQAAKPSVWLPLESEAAASSPSTPGDKRGDLSQASSPRTKEPWLWDR